MKKTTDHSSIVERFDFRVLFSIFVFWGWTINTHAQNSLDLTIEQAFEYAKQNNANIKQSKLDILISERKVKETTAIGLPQINAKIDYNNFLRQPVTLVPAQFFGGNPGEFAEVVFGTKQNMTASATLSQLLFDGSYLVGLQSARTYRKISELMSNKTELTIKEAVYQNYAAILIVRENLKVLEKNIQLAEKNLTEFREIFKVGLGEEQTVDQAEYTVVNLKSLHFNLKQNEDNLLSALKFLIGADQKTNIQLTTTIDEILYSKETYEDELEISQELQNHIDYKITQVNEDAKRLMLRFEKSKALPTLSGFLSTQYQVFSNQFDFTEQKWFNATFFGIGLSIPIFSSFARHNRTQQAKIDLDKAIIEKENTFERLKQQSKEKYQNYLAAIEQLESSKKLMQLSNKIYETQRIKFQEGIGSSLELANAENQKYQAQNTYIQSMFQVIQARIAFESSLGKL